MSCAALLGSELYEEVASNDGVKPPPPRTGEAPLQQVLPLPAGGPAAAQGMHTRQTEARGTDCSDSMALRHSSKGNEH